MALRLPYAGTSVTQALTEGWDTVNHVRQSRREDEEQQMRHERLRQAERQRAALANDLRSVELGDTSRESPWANYDPGKTSAPYTGTTQRPVTTASPAPASTAQPTYQDTGYRAGSRRTGPDRNQSPAFEGTYTWLEIAASPGMREAIEAAEQRGEIEVRRVGNPEVNQGRGGGVHIRRLTRGTRGSATNYPFAGGTYQGGTPTTTQSAPAAPGSSATPTNTRELLDHIAAPESGGRYDVLNGGETFNTNGPHPNRVGRGGTSTAAGRYQFIHETWQRAIRALGLPDVMSPANQDAAAEWLANNDYQANTGRNLQTDLQSGISTQQIASALGSTWTGLQDGGGGQAPRLQQASATEEDYTPALNEDIQRARIGLGLGVNHRESLNRLNYLSIRARNARDYGDIEGFDTAFAALQTEQVNERQFEAQNVIDRFTASGGNTEELSRMLAYYYGYSEGKNPASFAIVPDGNNPGYFVVMIDGRPVTQPMSQSHLVTEAMATVNEGFRAQLQEAQIEASNNYTEQYTEAMFAANQTALEGENQARVADIQGRYGLQRQLIQSQGDFDRARLTAMASGNRIVTAEGPNGRLIIEMRGDEPIRIYEVSSEMVDTPELTGGFLGLGRRRVQRPVTTRTEVAPGFESFDALGR